MESAPKNCPKYYTRGRLQPIADYLGLYDRLSVSIDVDFEYGYCSNDGPDRPSDYSPNRKRFRGRKNSFLLSWPHAGDRVRVLGRRPNDTPRYSTQSLTVRIFEILFPDAPSIAFGQWIVLGVPIGVIMIGVIWVLITQVFYRTPQDLKVDRAVVDRERSQLGEMSFEEKIVLAVFTMFAILLVLRVDLNLGFASIPGWSRLLPFPEMVDDGTVAIAMAAILFLIPTRDRTKGHKRIMGPDVIPRLPWNIVLLFGGGFALAAGLQQTGLATMIGEQLQALGNLPTFAMIMLVCIMITFLTELTSNTATTEMILPVLAAVAVVTGTHPLLLMIPATISASCAFMMPVATPPNAIVFGSERISVEEMVRIGIFLNLIGVLVITAIVLLVGTTVFGIDPSMVPDWANSMAAGPGG